MSQEAAIEKFKSEVRKVYALNSPMLPAGVKIDVADADKYTDLKNKIQEKARSISAPELDDEKKWEVIMSMEDELDMFIRNNHKKEN